MRRRWTRCAVPGIALAALASLPGCAGSANARVAPESVLGARATGEEIVVLDVRSSKEYASGHVPGAAHLPFQSTWTRRDALPASLDQPIVVYCEHGPRAALARFGLESLGYRDVRTLSGHMAGWRAEGLPVETGAR